MTRILLPLVLIHSFNVSYAQQNLVEQHTIIKSIENSTSKGFDRKKCKEFENFVFSVFITYSEKGSVEDVLISDCGECILKDRLEQKIKETLQKNSENPDFSNRFVISIVYVAPDSRRKVQSNNPPLNWQSVFNGVPIELLQNKTLLFSVPVALYIIDSAH